MRIRNLLSVGVLLGLAACDAEPKDTDTDTDTVGTEPEEEETPTGDTFPDEPTGPWNPYYIGVFAQFGLDAENNLISVENDTYGTLVPFLLVTFGNEDYEECYIDVDLSGAVVSAGVGDQWITITSNAGATVDGCEGVAEFDGYGSPGAGYIGATIVLTLGPLDVDFFSYITLEPVDSFLGGTLLDNVYFGYYGAEPVYAQGFPLTDMELDEPYDMNSVQVGAGVQEGFYYMATYSYLFY